MPNELNKFYRCTLYIARTGIDWTVFILQEPLINLFKKLLHYLDAAVFFLASVVKQDSSKGVGMLTETLAFCGVFDQTKLLDSGAEKEQLEVTRWIIDLFQTFEQLDYKLFCWVFCMDYQIFCKLINIGNHNSISTPKFSQFVCVSGSTSAHTPCNIGVGYPRAQSWDHSSSLCSIADCWNYV